MVEKTNKLINLIAKYLFIIFVCIFSIANIFFTARQINNGTALTDYQFGITPINVAVLLIVLILFVVLNKNNFFGIKEKHYLIALLIVVSLIGLYWIFSNARVLIDYDDSYNCFEAAKGILAKDYSVLGFKSYVNTYPHNLPLITYFAIIIKIFGEQNAITVITLINLIFVILAYLYLYKITSRLFNNRKTSMNLITLMFFSMQFVFFSYYVYGNVMSVSLSFISIYYLLDYFSNYKVKSMIISIITICVGVGIKNNVLIVLITEIIYLIIEFINKKNAILLLIIVLMISGTYLCTSGVIKFWEKKANYSYDNRLPKICWIAYGLNYDERHPGSYLNAFEDYHVKSGYVVEYTEQKAKDFIKGTLSDFKNDPSLIPKFLGEKILIAWTNPEYGVFSYLHIKENNTNDFNYSLVNGKANDVINTIWDGTLSIVSIGLLTLVIRKRKCIDTKALILAVIFIGGFLFHSFWELASRYMIHYYLCLLPYAAHGLMLLFNKEE